jgi:hypothetical protein
LQSTAQALVDLMDASALYTLYIACTPTTIGATRVAMCVGATGSSHLVYHGIGSTGLDLASRFEAAQTTNTGSVARIVNESRRLTAVYTGSAYSLWQRGSQALNAGANTRAPVCNRFVIGALMLSGGLSTFWIGDIQDIVIFNGVNHDASTRTAIEALMVGQWGP